tara:strand:- start:2 stop:607 length:606 start_codon:yes stop_codon:yes gene_type:complete
MKEMKATFDLTRLSDRQLKNIKKYYQRVDFSSWDEVTVTKHIAQDLWIKHGVDNHPHTKSYYDSVEVKNYPCSHKIWADVRKYLVMCKLADTSVYDIEVDKLTNALERVESIIKQGQNPMWYEKGDVQESLIITRHRVQRTWTVDNEEAVPKNCVLNKLLKGVTDNMVPMSDINPGIMEIDSMINRNTTEYIETFIGENND